MDADRPHEILIVDDEPAALRVMERLLTRLGYVVVTASNGREALERVRNHNPAVVVTDIAMPEMDGIALLGELSTIAPKLRVICISGAPGDTRLENAFAVLGKPIDFDALESAIETALTRT